MRAPFLGQAYQSRSPVLSSQTAINIYPELTEGNSEEVGAFYGTPGILGLYTVVSYARGMHVAGNQLYNVSGNQVWVTASLSAGPYSFLGTLPNSTGRVSIADNGTQVVIAHAGGWHYSTIPTGALTAVTGAPTSASVAFLDGYILFPTTAGHFGITALNDVSTIDPLDVATAEGSPDDLLTIITNHREAWLFGDTSIEIWTNTGAALFPFERQPGGFIEMGCAAKYSPVNLDGSIFWVGKNINGSGIVYRSNGYEPVRISTHPIEHAIAGYGDISDAFGYGYQDEGHSFYVLTFPTASVTWVYDTATQGWHQRGWLDSNGNLKRHRSNCYARFGNTHVVGDFETADIYKMSLDIFTDQNQEIYRERAFQLPEVEHKKGRIDEVEILATIGDGASPATIFGGADFSAVHLWLQVSRDAGRTFGYQRIISTGAIGQTQARARWRRIGTGRNFVIRIATTMANRVQWVAGFVRGEVYSE